MTTHEIIPGDEIIGYFEPKRVDNLVSGAIPFIGQLLKFEFLWIITEEDGGPYVGQWALRPKDKFGIWLPMGWIPFEDIRIDIADPKEVLFEDNE